ncbi:MAG: hypothetical protein ACT4QF_10820 [Sporichthyaceae bacterium]
MECTGGRREWSLPLLAGAIAVGLGVLGWLAARYLTLFVLGHAHASTDGNGFRHVHGWSTSLAVGAGAMVALSVLALTVLPKPTAPRTAPLRLLPGALLPAGVFAALELATAVHSGAGLRPTAASLLLGVGLHAGIGLGATRLARACIEWATAPVPPRVGPIPPRRLPAVGGTLRPGRSRRSAGGQGLRGPPRAVGF